ncbi:winged helix DNA-binding protein [Haloplanus halobius]|uniref:winged helix DNA-binding protein n=1 Tax=Haloplanus halobius TaxID=2934938 RepID=UPI00200E44B1|nr:winged helix DNA-binding protein [Haloplanus sp. XH21]
MTSLREKDRIILTCIANGKDDVQKITAATTLENHHVTYAFKKLEKHGLIQVEKPDGMVKREINGQKRVFQHPKQSELTDKGQQRLEHEEKDLDQYENLTHRELVEKVHQLEEKVERIDRKIDTLREQILERIE